MDLIPLDHKFEAPAPTLPKSSPSNSHLNHNRSHQLNSDFRILGLLGVCNSFHPPFSTHPVSLPQPLLPLRHSHATVMPFLRRQQRMVIYSSLVVSFGRQLGTTSTRFLPAI